MFQDLHGGAGGGGGELGVRIKQESLSSHYLPFDMTVTVLKLGFRFRSHVVTYMVMT